jgi:2-alkyl-3-oxoalkanoate reductase
VLGRPVVQSLTAQGHKVRVLAHSPKAEGGIRDLGGEPVHFDLLDPASTAEGVGDAEVVLHLATRIPPSSTAGKREAWVDNDRLRTEGTRNLVHAALAGRVQMFLYPSTTLSNPDSGTAWIDAENTQPAPIAFVCSTLDAEAEVRRFAEGGRRGITLRMANFYGPESGHTRDVLAYARKGIAAVLGSPDAFLSSVWIGDAAQAVTAALERAPAGVYDVVDARRAHASVRRRGRRCCE